MKVIKIGNDIISLENVKSVSANGKNITITYMSGYIIPSSQVFAHHHEFVNGVKDVEATLEQIYKILSEG